MTVITLRPATRADDEFCYQLHKAAMRDYVAAVWGWDEQVQRAYHARAFKPRRWQIITVNGADTGMLSVEYRPDEVYLARIEILPGRQGQGIGTHIIGALLAEARRRGQDLVLDVLVVNERARALYDRLGLAEVARLGDGDIKIRMRSANGAPVAGYGTRPTAHRLRVRELGQRRTGCGLGNSANGAPVAG